MDLILEKGRPQETTGRLETSGFFLRNKNTIFPNKK